MICFLGSKIRLFRLRMSIFSISFLEENAPGMLGEREGRESFDKHIERISDVAISECENETAIIISETEAIKKGTQVIRDQMKIMMQDKGDIAP